MLFHSKQVDTNPRYKADNILTTELDMPEKTTQEFAGPGMKSRVDQILAMDLNGDDGDDVQFNSGDAIPSPYLSYEGGPAGAPDANGDRSGASRSAGASASSRPKTGKKTSSKSSSGGGGGGNSAAVAADPRDYNNYSAGNGGGGGSQQAYYSGSGGNGGGGSGAGSNGGSSGGGSSRPKSATRRSTTNEAAANSAYRVQDEAPTSKSRYGGNDEDLYPTARGLIKK